MYADAVGALVAVLPRANLATASSALEKHGPLDSLTGISGPIPIAHVFCTHSGSGKALRQSHPISPVNIINHIISFQLGPPVERLE